MITERRQDRNSELWSGIKGMKGKKSESCSVMSDSLRSHGLYSPWNSPGQNTGVGTLSLLQGILPTQGPTWAAAVHGVAKSRTRLGPFGKHQS